MEQQPPISEEPGSGPSPETGSQRSPSDRLREAISRAWETGAEDARQTARDAVPRARQAAGEFAADLAYGLGYGASFAATLLDHLGAKDAWFSNERGMTAGRDAAQDLIRRFGQRNPVPPPPAAPGEGPQAAT